MVFFETSANLSAMINTLGLFTFVFFEALFIFNYQLTEKLSHLYI
jgi:hypothetical protein